MIQHSYALYCGVLAGDTEVSARGEPSDAEYDRYMTGDLN